VKRNTIWASLFIFVLLLVIGGNFIIVKAQMNYPGSEDLDNHRDTSQGTIISAAAYEGINMNGESYTNTSAPGIYLYYPFISKNSSKGGAETTLVLQNVGSSTTTQLEIWFYDSPTDSTPTIVPRQNINPGGSQEVSISSLDAIANGFIGSAIVVADQPIAGVAMVERNDLYRLMIYRAVSHGHESMLLPRISRNAQGWNSIMAVQNVGNAMADIEITYVSSSGEITHVIEQGIAPGAMYAVDAIYISELGDSFTGWAQITSNGGTITAMALEEQSNRDVGAAYNAVALGPQLLLSPRQQKDVDGWYSNTILVNDIGSEVNFSMDYVDQLGASIWMDDNTIGSDILIYDTADLSGIPAGFNGGLFVSADQPLVGLATWNKPDQKVGDTYAAAGLISGTASKIIFPYAPHSESNLLSTELSIQNSGTETAEVTLKFVDKNGNVVYTLTDSIPAGGVNLFDTTMDSGMIDEFVGGVIVESAAHNSIVGYATIIERTTEVIPNEWLYLPAVLNAPCQTLYYDDFSDQSSGWPVGDDGDVRYEYLNSEYRLLVRDTYLTVFVDSNFQAADYTLIADVRNATGNYGTYGLVFGLSADGSQFYSFEVDSDGYYKIRRYSDSSGLLLLIEGWSSKINTGTTSNRLKVVRNGTEISAYANGQVLETIYDGVYTGSRYMGLIASSYYQSNVDVRFDNFTVYPVSCRDQESKTSYQHLGNTNNTNQEEDSSLNGIYLLRDRR
jgi:hypothetical protein